MFNVLDFHAGLPEVWGSNPGGGGEKIGELHRVREKRGHSIGTTLTNLDTDS